MKQQFSFKRKFVTTDETDTDETDDTKRKSRNLSEKKRRDQFNDLITELSSMVGTSSRKMDKTSVLKSTIALLKNNNGLSKNQTFCKDESWKPYFLCNEEFTHLMLEALEAFVLVFSVTTGKIIYISENVASLLGYSANDFNLSIFQMIHESEKSALYEMLQHDSFSSEIDIFLHMKHGPIHFPTIVGFEAVHMTGSFYKCSLPDLGDCDSNSCSTESFSTKCEMHVVALVRFCNSQLFLEMPLFNEPKKEFVSKHSLEWKFLFLDHRASMIIGYLPFEVLGTLAYDYYHVDDLEKVVLSHKTLKETGEGISCYYRFLTKGQQWIWLQTRWYITYNQWNSKPECVFCTHTVFNYNQEELSRGKKAKNVSTLSKASDFDKKSVSSALSRTSFSSCYSNVSTASSVISISDEVGPSTCISHSFLMQDCTLAEHMQIVPPIVTLASPIVTLALSEITNVEDGPLNCQMHMPNYQCLQLRYQQLQQQILVRQEESRRILQQLLSMQFVTNSAVSPLPEETDSTWQDQSEDQSNCYVPSNFHPGL